MAYPDTDIPLARLQRARAAAARREAARGRRGMERPDDWVTAWARAMRSIPFTEFRNSFGYVPNEYVASGRTTALAIDPNCAHTATAASGSSRPAAACGAPRTRSAARRAGSSSRATSGSSRAARSRSTRTTHSGDTLYVGTGEANASGDSAAGVGLYKSTDGGDTWTGPLGARVVRRPRRSAASPSSPAIRTRSTWPRPAASRRLLRDRRRRVARSRARPRGASTSPPTAARPGRSCTTARPRRAQCDTVAEASARRLRPARCAACGASRSTRRPRHRVRRLVRRGVWRSTDARRDLDPDQALAQRGRRPPRGPSSPSRRCPTARPACTCTKGAPGSPTSRLFRSDDVATGVPVFTNLSSTNLADPGYGTLQRLHRSVLVRQLRLHAGRPSRHRLRRRLVLVRREPALQQARRRALDRRGRHVRPT